MTDKLQRIVADEAALAKERQTMQPMPVICEVTQKEIRNTYLLIQQDIQDMVEQVLEQILNDPSLEHLIVRKS
ncbi:MAG: hypothetical protein QM781_15055 [Chitinophagaceae bacterium]